MSPDQDDTMLAAQIVDAVKAYDNANKKYNDAETTLGLKRKEKQNRKPAEEILMSATTRTEIRTGKCGDHYIVMQFIPSITNNVWSGPVLGGAEPDYHDPASWWLSGGDYVGNGLRATLRSPRRLNDVDSVDLKFPVANGISAKSIPFHWASVSRNLRTTALVAWQAERPMETDMDNITNRSFDPKLLKEDFENTAEWRRTVAAEHPDDSRNTEAAQILDTLAATTSAVDQAVLDAYGELFEQHTESEAHSEMLRQIGFHSCPSSATEFVQAFIASQTGAKR